MTVELLTRYGKILAGFVLLWVLVWLLNNVGCSRVGGEMTPTIPADKNAWMDPKVRHPEQLRREDIVAYQFEAGGRPMARIAARVVGLPGDRVKMVKGDLFVNGEKLSASYASDKAKIGEDYAEIVVPRNSVFVLCDNRTQTRGQDSRTLGPIAYWSILGRLK